jgi:N-methylhydantoinase A
MMPTGGLVVGVDVGGTFTDVFLLDPANGRFATAKVPTTARNQAEGLAAGVSQVADPSAIRTLVHGTTVGTNALLQRGGARTGLITTRGFRDALEMRRRDRPETWGLWGSFEPIVPRDLRLEVEERTLADGTILMAVDPEDVRAACQQLLDAGVEALCIAFINAYANPSNEEAALAAAREIWPTPHVVSATAVVPEIREFERTSTAALNAYVQPLMARYLDGLESRLRRDSFDGRVLIVQSNGGTTVPEDAARLPIRTALSGPAAGVIAGAGLAQAGGYRNVITCDMGGTSFDVAVIAQDEIASSAETAIDFGLVIRSPMIEISTIGAGGGSIAHVDASGFLEIGPESAGADPGPACYGRGGARPTVTDANLVLGRINATRPIGGVLQTLDATAARSAIDRFVGEPLDLEGPAAAEAILRIADAKLSGAIRLVSIERGHDPRDFTAIMFGGGGGLHACALLRDVGLDRALLPRFPGVTSALGCILAEPRRDTVHTVNRALEADALAAIVREMQKRAAAEQAQLRAWGAEPDALETRFMFDMAYVGQSHSVQVPLVVSDGAPTLGLTVDTVRTAFEERYQALSGRILALPIRVVTVRVTVTARKPSFDFALFAPPTGSVEAASRGSRDVWCDGAGREASVYDRLSLPVEVSIDGPAVLEQPDATIFVEPAFRATIDDCGSVVLARV